MTPCPSCSQSVVATAAQCPACGATLEAPTEKLSGGENWGWPATASAPKPMPEVKMGDSGWLGEATEDLGPAPKVKDIWAKEPEDEFEQGHKITIVQARITRGTKEITGMLMLGLFLMLGTSLLAAARVHLAPPAKKQEMAASEKTLEKARMIRESGVHLLENQDVDSAITQFQTALTLMVEAEADIKEVWSTKSNLAAAFDDANRPADSQPLWSELMEAEGYSEEASARVVAAEKKLRIAAEAAMKSGQAALAANDHDEARRKAGEASDLFSRFNGSAAQRGRAKALLGRAWLKEGKPKLASTEFAQAHAIHPSGGYDKLLPKSGRQVASTSAPPAIKKASKRPSAVPRQNRIPTAQRTAKVNRPSPAAQRQRKELAASDRFKSLNGQSRSGPSPMPVLSKVAAETDPQGRVFLKVSVKNPKERISKACRLEVRLSHHGNRMQTPLNLSNSFPGVPAGGKAELRVNTPFESRKPLKGKTKSFNASNIEPDRDVNVSFSVKLRK